MGDHTDLNWREGCLMAASVLVGAHDQPTMAADVLHELGLSDADCSALSDYDKENLRKVRKSQRGPQRLRGLDRSGLTPTMRDALRRLLNGETLRGVSHGRTIQTLIERGLIDGPDAITQRGRDAMAA